MNRKLENKLSIGLSLSLSLEEYKVLFEKYKYYIHDIYFSPPLGDKYHSRGRISKQFMDKKNIEKFYQILELAKENDIKLDCVLNRPMISFEMVAKALEYLKNFPVDQITCLSRHVDMVNQAFPEIPLIYSFNNDFSIQDLDKVSKKFSTIVVGKSLLRSREQLRMIYESGFHIKLLVNNGCSFNCKGCQSGKNECYRTFMCNLEKYGIQYLYALQSFYPFELDMLLTGIDFPIESIKISNRTDGYDYLERCIESYVELKEPSDYTKEDPVNFRLWARTGNFNGYLEQLDQDEIIKIKTKKLIIK